MSALSLTQRLALSGAVDTADRLCRSGYLSMRDEMDLRFVAAALRSAFPVDVPERSNVIDLDTAAQSLVRKEFERVI